MTSILLVEDDPELREELADALKMEGYAITEASDGREALERLKTHGAPSLILLDLLMPVMNGWELCKALRRDAATARIPIVVMSGAVSRDPQSPYFIDVDDFVTKPINLADLLATLKKYAAGDRASAFR